MLGSEVGTTPGPESVQEQTEPANAGVDVLVDVIVDVDVDVVRNMDLGCPKTFSLKA